MTSEDVKNLIKLREFVAGYYDQLEGKTEPTAVVQTRDVSLFCESIARSIDDLIRDHVTFQ